MACTVAGLASVAHADAFECKGTETKAECQLVPTLDFVSGDYYMRYGDRMHFGIDGSVGIRFWFK